MSMSMRSLLIRMRVMDAQMTLSRWYLGWDLYRAMPFPGMRGRGLHDKAKGLVEHDRELIRSMAELEGRAHG